MPISTQQLREATRRSFPPRYRTLAEARNVGAKSVFLCHSHLDADIVRGLITLLHERGINAYVDWADPDMPPKPNRVTADRLKARIREASYLFFLATANSMASRWCPWEIGFADGAKGVDTVIVCPTTDGSTTYGNEYLDLYRRLDWSSLNELAIWYPGRSDSGVRINTL